MPGYFPTGVPTPGGGSYMPPKIDFSPLGQLPNAYYQGQQAQHTLALENAFPNGLPTKNGQVDIGAMTDTLARLGGAQAAMPLVKLDIMRQIGEGNAAAVGGPGGGVGGNPAQPGLSTSTPSLSRQPNNSAGTSPESYEQKLFAGESGNRPNAHAETSSAGGLAGFTDGTWKDLMDRHPELNLTPGGQYDPQQVARALPVYTAENEHVLAYNSVPINDGNKYLAHVLGAQGASDFYHGLRRNPNAPADNYASPAAVAANHSLFYDKQGNPRTAIQTYRLITGKMRDVGAKANATTRASRARAQAPTGNAAPAGGTAPASFAQRFPSQGEFRPSAQPAPAPPSAPQAPAPQPTTVTVTSDGTVVPASGTGAPPGAQAGRPQGGAPERPQTAAPSAPHQSSMLSEHLANEYEKSAQNAFRRAAAIGGFPGEQAAATSLYMYGEQQMRQARAIRQGIITNEQLTNEQKNAAASGYANPADYEGAVARRKALAANLTEPPSIREFHAAANPGETLPQFKERLAAAPEMAKQDITLWTKRYTGVQQQGATAIDGAKKAQLLKGLTEKPGFYSGPMHEGMEDYQQWKAIFGAAPPTNALPMEAFNKLTNDMLQQQVKSMGQSGVGRVLQSEVNMMRQAIASLGITPASNRALATIIGRVYNREEAIAKIARTMPKIPGKLNTTYDALSQHYLQQHPLFSPDEIAHPELLAAPDVPPGYQHWTAAQVRGWAESINLKPGDPVRLPDGKIAQVP